ncbi:MAG: hypothetical protein ABI693_13465 [Bryobacteraceae bacterium]
MTDDPVNGKVGTLSVGAEYLAHSLSGSGATAAANVEKKVVLRQELAVECALEEGSATSARRGYLCFPWKGKLKALRSVELLDVSAYGNLTLKLF